MADVTVKSLVKRFENVVAVNNIDLKIDDKEFIVLVGPSGCGKTTTLRVIAGLEEPNSGEIYIGDRLVNDVPPKDRNIAMVFQNYALYPHMKVYNNMAFGLKMRKMPKNEIDRRVRWGAAILGIEDLLHRKPRQLSGGQRQRVALGRAIVREPQVFLLDEPLSNLDAQLRVQMRTELKKLHSRLEATMIYVTHDQVEAMSMGDRIVVMKDGLIQQIGSPLEVYNEPVNRFVAGFIGSPSMNFVTGVVQERGSHTVVDLDTFSLKMPERSQEVGRAHLGKEITVGIRPEHIYVGENSFQGTSKSQPIEALVEVYEAMGSVVVLELSVQGNNFVAQVDPNTPARSRKSIKMYFDEDRLHLFDLRTGKVLQ